MPETKPLATTEELVSGIRALDHDLIELEHRVSSLEKREYENEREIEHLKEAEDARWDKLTKEGRIKGPDW